MLFGVCVEHEYDLIMFIARQLFIKSENNGCSIYMSNIFYGQAPLKSGLFLLNLDCGDTHIHNIDAKRCKVDNDSATYLWHCRLGHIGVKAHEETSCRWTFGIT